MKRLLLTAACVIATTAWNTMMAKGDFVASDGLCGVIEMNALSNNVVKRQVNVKYFSKIDIKGAVDVVFKQTNGGKPQVTIAGGKDVVERLSVRSDGKTLTVSEKSGVSTWHMFGSNRDAKVYVSAPDLTAVRIVGSGDFDAEGKVDTDNLLIDVRGSGDVEMKSVICDNAKIQILGSGDVEIKNLVAQKNADINVKGSGDVEVNFAKSGMVSCSIAGSGDVKLKGYVKGLKKHVNGSGDLETSKLKRW